MSDINEAFEKATAGQAQDAAPQGQAAPAPEVSQPAQGQAEPTQEAPKEAPKGTTEREWDGKSDTLVNELKQDPKAIQRAYTKKAMEAAELRKQLGEFQGLNKQEVEAYKQWKQQQDVARQQQLVQQPPQPTQLTPEQMDIIKNDPNAFSAYVQSLVSSQVQQAAQMIVPEIQQMKYNQSLAEWERTIADFGEIHPDMWEMHQAGLFRPILEATVKSGGTLDDAYNEAAKIRDAFRVKAEVDAQVGIKAKREAASLPGTTSGSDDVVYAENSRDALNKAFELAYSKKEYVAKDATVTPRGRVRIRK